MKRLVLSLSFLAGIIASQAQNIYQLEAFSSTDLNGTARYVGMGGAMSALGADLSVMSSNPGAIGLYRSSDVAGTLSYNAQEDAKKFNDKSGKYMSFDNLGFVYSFKADANSLKFINIGFNYSKHKDFNQLSSSAVSFDDPKKGPSLGWQMRDITNFWANPTCPEDIEDKSTPLGWMGYQTGMLDYDSGNHDITTNSRSHQFNKALWGSTSKFDMSLAFNFSDQWYFGLAVGVYNMKYKSCSLYSEDIATRTNKDAGVTYPDAGKANLSDERKITGTGVDFKLGLVARPIEDNPFRLGVAITTPTYYDLKSRSYSCLDVIYEEGGSPDPYAYEMDYRYNVTTPWKFNFSLGSTFMNCLAIDAEYEYTDFGRNKVSYETSYWDGYGYDTENDRALNNEAKHQLKGVSTFKLGAEWCVDGNIFFRLGYNHVTSPYSNKAFYNQFIDSASLDYATTADYMNLSAINRYTLGVGWSFGKFYADVAFMYQNQHGNLYAFSTQDGDENQINKVPATRVKLNRVKGMLTLGYRF